MVYITSAYCDSWWFGVAWAENDLVATVCESSREKAFRLVTSCVPSGIAVRVESEPSEFAAGVITMLGELERGIEERKRFTLSPYLSEPQRRILTVAAAIPIGYVSTYGNIANAAGSEARAVGRAMATNPLYPIVPCHRVVGADLALVGYGGRQDPDALAAKHGRLKAEARGAVDGKDIPVFDSLLAVVPVERVLETAEAIEKKKLDALKKEADRLAAERAQLRLF
jgi:methylated-DNA-[protein]-cysteine S-methyltransferase